MIKFLLLTTLLVACSTTKEKPEEELPETPVVVAPLPEVPGGIARWQPRQGAKFQILDEDDGNFAKQIDSGTEFVNIELFAATKMNIFEIHQKGVKVVCYYNLAYQPGNPDIDGKTYEGWRNPLLFPKAALGPEMDDYDEKWTDLTNENLHLFNDQRDILAKNLGCDGVEGGDNMDNNSGEAFSKIKTADLVKSNKRRADHAHSLGLAHFAKNTPEIAKQASLTSDAIFIEQALTFEELDDYSAWWTNGRGVYAIEYPSVDPDNLMFASRCKKLAKNYPKVKVDYHGNGDYFNKNSNFCN